MAGLIVTREVHAEIREIIARNANATNAFIAKQAGVSDKTIKRIRSGGRSYIGYKRQLSKDHLKFTTDLDMPPAEHMEVDEPRFRPPKPSLFKRLKARLG